MQVNLDDNGDVFVVDATLLVRKEVLCRSFHVATVAFLKIQNRIQEFETEFEVSPQRACCDLVRMHTQINEFSERYSRFVCAGRSFLDHCSVDDHETHDNTTN